MDQRRAQVTSFLEWQMTHSFYLHSDQRIIVKDLEEDLKDGQILGKLVEKLSEQKLDVVEVTQNEDAQKAKLRTVLDQANRLLGIQAKWGTVKWTVEGIHF